MDAFNTSRGRRNKWVYVWRVWMLRVSTDSGLQGDNSNVSVLNPSVIGTYKYITLYMMILFIN